MTLDERIDIFEKTPIARAVLTLAVPTVLSNLVMILYNLADTYFVGMLAQPVENAAVTLAGPVLLAFNAVNNLFGIGCSSLISRSLGKKDYDAVKRTSSFGFWASLFSALFFSVLSCVFNSSLLSAIGVTDETLGATASYMKWTVTFGAVPAILNVVMAYFVRSEGSALHASIGTMSGCILNVIIDPFFILPWGLGLGAEGAGIATFISNCVALSYFLILFIVKKRKKNTWLSISLGDFGLKRAVVFGVCAVGIPASIQNLLNVTGMTILNNFAAAFGADAVAAIGIAQKIHNVPMSTAMGMAGGTMPLVSYNWSSGNYVRMKECLVFSRRIMLSFLCSVMVLFIVFSDPIVGAFMDNSHVVELGSFFLSAMSLTLPLIALDFLAVNVFQAIGLGRGSLLFAITRKLILEIPLLFFFNAVWPLYGLPFAQVASEFVLAVTAVIVLERILRKKGV